MLGDPTKRFMRMSPRRGDSYVTSTEPTAEVCTPRQRLWSTMECSQPNTWTTTRSLLVASRAKAFPARPTNSDSTLPRAANLDGGAIGCDRCIHLAFVKCSGISRHATNALSRMITNLHLHAPILPTAAMTNYTHTHQL